MNSFFGMKTRLEWKDIVHVKNTTKSGAAETPSGQNKWVIFPTWRIVSDFQLNEMFSFNKNQIKSLKSLFLSVSILFES